MIAARLPPAWRRLHLWSRLEWRGSPSPACPPPGSAGAAVFWLGSVVASDVVASVDVGLFAEASVVVPWSFLDAVFGVTGTVAATAAVLRGWVGRRRIVPPASQSLTVTAEGAAGFAVVVPASSARRGVSGSVVRWNRWPKRRAAVVLAAIAAAAMASGAVGRRRAAVSQVLLGADVGTATATGVGVVAVLAACCARRAASTAVASVSVAESLDFASVVCVESVVVVEDDWLALSAEEPLALAVVLEPAPLASATADCYLPLLPESSFAGGGFDELLLAGARIVIGVTVVGAAARRILRRGGGGADRAVLRRRRGRRRESLRVFWPTRPAKSRSPAARRIASATTAQPGTRHWLRLRIWGSTEHRTASGRNSPRVSKYRATRLILVNILVISMVYRICQLRWRRRSAPSFLPGGKICRYLRRMGAVIASRQPGLY